VRMSRIPPQMENSSHSWLAFHSFAYDFVAAISENFAT
jgi:hypothetical protein